MAESKGTERKTTTVAESKSTTVTLSDGTELDGAPGVAPVGRDGRHAPAEGSDVCDYRGARSRVMDLAWAAAKQLEAQGETVARGDMGSLIRAGWARVRTEQERAACLVTATHRMKVERYAEEIEQGG